MPESISKADLIARVHRHLAGDNHRHTRQWVIREIEARQGWQFYHSTMYHIELAEHRGIKLHQILQEDKFAVINTAENEGGGVNCSGCGKPELEDSVTIRYTAGNESVLDIKPWGVDCIVNQYDAFGPRRKTHRKQYITGKIRKEREAAEKGLVQRVMEHYAGRIKIEDFTPEMRAQLLRLIEQDQALLKRYKAIDYDYAQQRAGMLEEARVKLRKSLEKIADGINSMPLTEAAPALRLELQETRGYQALRNTLLNNPNITDDMKDKVERMYAVTDERRLSDREYNQVTAFMKFAQLYDPKQLLGSVIEDLEYSLKIKELSGEAYLWIAPIIAESHENPEMRIDGFTALKIMLADPRDSIKVRVKENTETLRAIDEDISTSMVEYIHRVVMPAYQRDHDRYSEISTLRAALRIERTDANAERIDKLRDELELTRGDYRLMRRVIVPTLRDDPNASAIEKGLVEKSSRPEFYSLANGELKLLTQKTRYQSWANQRHKEVSALNQTYISLEDVADELKLNDVQVAATAIVEELNTNEPNVKKQIGASIIERFTTAYVDNGRYVNFQAQNRDELTDAAQFGIIRRDLVQNLWRHYNLITPQND